MKRALAIHGLFLLAEIGGIIGLFIANNMGVISLSAYALGLFVAILGFFALGTVASLIGAIRRASFRAAVLAGDDRRAPRVAQPDPALALAPGETITLTRWRTGRGWFMGTFLALPLLYSWVFTGSSLFQRPDFAIVGEILMPIVGALAVFLLIAAIDSARVTITVADNGITIRRVLWRRQIAWSAIRGFATVYPVEALGMRVFSLYTAHGSLDLKFNDYPLSALQRKHPLERVAGDLVEYLRQA